METSKKKSIEAGIEILPKKTTDKRKHWITPCILSLMEQRKTSKQDPVKYNHLNKLIDKKCREAKEMWLHQKCENIDKMARLHQSRAMYGKIKEITGQDRYD